VRAAGFVILVMFNVADPQLTPDLDQRSFTHIKLDEHQRCQVALRVVVREVGVRVAEPWVVRRADNVVSVTWVLQTQHITYISTKLSYKLVVCLDQIHLCISCQVFSTQPTTYNHSFTAGLS